MCGPAQKDAVFLFDCQAGEQEDHAKCEESEEKLWKLSEQMVGQTFGV